MMVPQKDEGMILVGNALRNEENHNVKLADLNETSQIIVIFLTTITWACGNHSVKNFWTRSSFEMVKRNLQRLVWQKFGDKHASIGHIINCWKGTMIYLSERLQNGDTLAQAWSNNNWEMQWCQAQHTELSLGGSGSKGKGKGKKRPRDDDADSDRN